MVTNNRLGIIYVRKRTPQEWLVLGFLVMPFALAFLTELLRLPSFIRYLMDLLVVGLSMMLFVKRYFIISSKARPMLTLALVFFLYILVAYLFNYQSLFYFVWGTRNTFRFYLAFLVYVAYVTEEDATQWLRFLDVLFWMNLVVSIYQFAILRVHQDLLGGIFGVNATANGYTLVFFCIVIGKSLFQAFEGKEYFLYCALKCLGSLVVAAMAELKFYYVALILILAITTCLTRISRKKIALLMIAIAGVIIGASLLTFWFSEFEGFLSLEKLWELATKENYSSNKDLNRLSAIYTLMNNYVTDVGQQLFGLGLGNCDMSDVAIFNSTFYQNYSYLHYTWFSSAMIFLETGFIGLAIYLLFFVLCIVYSFKQLKRHTGNKLFCQISILMAFMCIAITFYSASLRFEAGYMAYFALALPFIREKSGAATVNNAR